MKEYTVRTIAQMLGTNEETVRRWIRDGKLHATCASRKTGNRVSEEDLRQFLQKRRNTISHSGVAPSVMAGASLAGAAALGLSAPMLPAVFTAAAYTALQTSPSLAAPPEEQPVPAKELGILLDKQIKLLEEQIASTENLIASQQKQLDVYRAQLSIYKGTQNILKISEKSRKKETEPHE